MLTGAHVVIYSKNDEADRTFFKDILGFPSVDAGHGWLIFGLPPAEVAFHPAESSGKQELYLMVRDIEQFVGQMRALGVPCGTIHDQRWGRLIEVTLPGGGALAVYQPRHERPPSVPAV